MIIVQIVLLFGAIALAMYFLANRKKARAKASVKLGFVIFLLACVVAIIFPELLTSVAHWVGVGRGADLLLYGLVFAFFFTTLSTWMRFREQELRYARLARRIALENPVWPLPVEEDSVDAGE
ncbi:MAG: DUF2304 domain-containing protein [Corynebacterium sp.]|nr:DUF2304 domain-containing protein [Corynebacterium sp.]